MLSPDGESLAITLGGNGRSALAFVDLDDRRITSGVRTGGEQFEIHDFAWWAAPVADRDGRGGGDRGRAISAPSQVLASLLL